MSLKNKKTAIIGGGPGGLTLARLLQIRNFEVKVYERDLDEKARVQGSPLDMHENSGMAALRKAGLLEQFKKSYMPGADGTTITNESGNIFFNDHKPAHTENFEDTTFRPEIDRGVLRKLLLDSLEPSSIVWGSRFISMEQEGEGWLLHFEDGRSSYADLVIGSDGANSKIRPYLTDIQAFYTGITMLEGTVYHGAQAAPRISALLKGGKVMAFGNEKNILMGQKANGEIGFYTSFKTSADWAVKSGLDFSDRIQMLDWFKRYYPEWDAIWFELFENAATPFIPRRIMCMPFDQSWKSLPNLTIIGDAAHVMPPFAGEGANMAMLDALELSECLESENFPTTGEAITAFETAMRSRAAVAAKASVDNGEKMHKRDALRRMLDFFEGTKQNRG